MISYLILIDEGLIEVVDEGFRIVHKATPRGLERMESSSAKMQMQIN